LPIGMRLSQRRYCRQRVKYVAHCAQAYNQEAVL
jgi:hypothetical protein